MTVSFRPSALPPLSRALAWLWLLSALLSPAQAKDNGLSDSLGQLAGFTDALGNRTTALYDACGNLIQLTDGNANRKTAETVSYPNPAGGSYSLSYGYQYSPAGNKTQLAWPDGTAISYGYSAHGELNSAAIPGEGIVSVNRFTWTAPATVTLPGGGAQQKSYDGLLNLEGFKAKSSGQQPLLNLSNQFGNLQELDSRSRTDTQGGNSNSTVTDQFGYDKELRLAQSVTASPSGTDTETFTLDAVGNRTAHSQVAGPWTYDANNRLVQRGTDINAVFYQYDEAGNLTQKSEPGKTTRYAYDTRNRLVAVKDGGGNLIARYGYDPFDRRIWKETYSTAGQGQGGSSGLRTYYLYADEGLIAEATQDIKPQSGLGGGEGIWSGGGTATTQPAIAAQYGPRPDAEFGTGLLFVKTKNGNGQDSFAYYHHDHLGAPILATDKNDNVVWAAQYNVFGRATITTPLAAGADSPTITSNLRLPGQYEDVETGLHYNWHRYYDPEIGRYLTRDPVGLDGGINTYAYVGNNPLNYTDSSGLIIDTIADAGFILYDLYKLASDSACERKENLTALGLDFVGAITPGVTGLGAASRVAKGVSTLDSASAAALKAAQYADEFTVPLKHLPDAAGRWSKFAEGTNPNALVKEALASDAAKFLPNNVEGSYKVVTDLGRVIGSNGETSLRVIIGQDGKIWTAFPTK